jgi:type I restriction enzyme S subunit
MLELITKRSQREDALMKKNEEASRLLKEYRSALITAAVTGQIDVETHARSGNTDRRVDALEQEAGA